MTLTFGSLFAGIGGIDLGLERAGMRCIYQVENNDYCNRVLSKHWPAVPRFQDVRGVGAQNLPYADLICGGFPCQDISNAGQRTGIAGARSGLWSEFARLVCELRPRYVLVENVAALLGRGLSTVLGDLSALGYDAEWECIPAAAIGAPHRRDRLFIVAYTDQERRNGRAGNQRAPGRIELANRCQDVPDADCSEWRTQPQGRHVFNRDDAGRQKAANRLSTFREAIGWDQWATEPAVGRMAHGVPARMDRLKGLGNAVVPQVAEFVGKLIVDYEAQL